MEVGDSCACTIDRSKAGRRVINTGALVVHVRPPILLGHAGYTLASALGAFQIDGPPVARCHSNSMAQVRARSSAAGLRPW
jgi:uncharacterized Zn-binding protein involved in type VI secretion